MLFVNHPKINNSIHIKINPFYHLTVVCLEYHMLLEILPIHLVFRFLPKVQPLDRHVMHRKPVLPNSLPLDRKLVAYRNSFLPNPRRNVLCHEPLRPNPLPLDRKCLLPNLLPLDHNVVCRRCLPANPLPLGRSSVQVQVPRLRS